MQRNAIYASLLNCHSNASGNTRSFEEEIGRVNSVFEQQRAQTTQIHQYLNEARIALDQIRREASRNQTLNDDMDVFQKQLDDIRQELYLHKTDITAQMNQLSAVENRDLMDLRTCSTSESVVDVLKRVLKGEWKRPLRYTAITQ